MNCFNRVIDVLQLECQIIFGKGSFCYLKVKFTVALFVVAKTWRQMYNRREEIYLISYGV